MNNKVKDLGVAQRLSNQYQTTFVISQIVPKLDPKMGTVRILLVRPGGNENLRELLGVICDDLQFDIDTIIDDDQSSEGVKASLEKNFSSEHVRFREVVNLSNASPDTLNEDYHIVFADFDDIYGEDTNQILSLLRDNSLVKGNLFITFPLLFKQPEQEALLDQFDKYTGTTLMRAVLSGQGEDQEISYIGYPQDLKGYFDSWGSVCRLRVINIYTGVVPDSDPAFIPFMILAYEIS